MLLFKSAVVPSELPDDDDVVTLPAPGALLGELPVTEADVLAAVLAAPGTPAHWAGPPEELLAEALALPVDEVAAALASLCRRLGVHEAGADRVASLARRARAIGVARR